jgi:hypothetical protein
MATKLGVFAEQTHQKNDLKLRDKKYLQLKKSARQLIENTNVPQEKTMNSLEILPQTSWRVSKTALTNR